MNPLFIAALGIILIIIVVLVVWVGLRKGSDDDPVSTRLAEFVQRGEYISIREWIKSLKSRLQGDSTTDAPPPEVKKKKKRK